MTASGRGITVSLLVHGAFIALIAALSASSGQERERVSIDLGLLQPAGHAAAPAPARRKAAPRPAVQPEAASPDAVPSPDPEQSPAPESASDQRASPDTGVETAAAGSGAGAVDAESLKQSYVNEYFSTIRDRIMKNLYFPAAARKMGWSGRVTVFFVISRSGDVEGIRIVQTTGYDVLDRYVTESVRRASPFPRPPVEAEITLPIVFKLI